jgi:hypothetical protein
VKLARKPGVRVIGLVYDRGNRPTVPPRWDPSNAAEGISVKPIKLLHAADDVRREESHRPR